MPRFDTLSTDADLDVPVIRGADGSAASAMFWREAVEMGHLDAQFLLGQYLADGRDPDEGMAWFRKAADNGHVESQFQMSRISRDGKESIAWLRKAAGQGHGKAQCRLGMAYWVGQGVPKDRVQGYAWMSLGSKRGTTPDDECRDLATPSIGDTNQASRPDQAPAPRKNAPFGARHIAGLGFLGLSQPVASPRLLSDRPDREGGNQQRRRRLPFIGDQRHSCSASGTGSGSGDQ